MGVWGRSGVDAPLESPEEGGGDGEGQRGLTLYRP